MQSGSERLCSGSVGAGGGTQGSRALTVTRAKQMSSTCPQKPLAELNPLARSGWDLASDRRTIDIRSDSKIRGANMEWNWKARWVASESVL